MKKVMTLVLLTLFVACTTQAEPSPRLIPFQGRLTNQDGVALASGQFTILFKLYDLPVGGDQKWSEKHEKVGIINGMINVFLGGVTPFDDPDEDGNPDDAVDFSETRYLGITIDADDIPNSSDPEMVPRQLIIPSFWAKTADFVTNADTVDNEQLANIMTKRDDNEERPGYDTNENGIVDRAEDAGPAGKVVAFAGANVPLGWLLCDGRSLSKSADNEKYLDLSNAIGELWGSGSDGPGLDQFNIPDLRGVFLRGVNGDRNDSFADPDKDSRTPLGPGAVANAVGSLQDNATTLPNTGFTANGAGTHTHSVTTARNFSPWTGSPIVASTVTMFLGPDINGELTIPTTAPTQQLNTNSSGGHGHDITGGGDSETRPQNAYVNYIIKY